VKSIHLPGKRWGHGRPRCALEASFSRSAQLPDTSEGLNLSILSKRNGFASVLIESYKPFPLKMSAVPMWSFIFGSSHFKTVAISIKNCYPGKLYVVKKQGMSDLIVKCKALLVGCGQLPSS